MTERVGNLSVLPEAEAKHGLLKLLGINLEFSYDEKLRSEIISDFIYDVFRLTLEKGFSHREIVAALKLTRALIEVAKGLNLPGIVAKYRELVEIADLNQQNRVVYTDFIFSTFMQHFKLYNFLFTSERDNACSTTRCVVNPPLPPPLLKEGKIPALHYYERQRKEIDSERQPLVQLQPIELEKLETHASANSSSQEEALAKIIDSVVSEVGSNFLENVTQVVSSTYHELDIKMRETLLPRPKQLGPPPRYIIPTATSVSKLAPQPTKPSKTSARSIHQ